MAILAIVQYEVHVLEQGRWHLHARYVREDRDRALEDARSTEAFVGRPTKVIRDVYDPDTGTNDESTIYISPRARRGPAQLPLAERQVLAIRGVRSRHRQRMIRKQAEAPSRRGLSPMFRILASVVIGLLVAFLITGLLAWLLSNGSGLNANTLSNLLLVVCLGAFLLTFLALVRGRTPWRTYQKERGDFADFD